MDRKIIEHVTSDEERAMYHTQSATVRDCVFAGPADGESALKESRDIEVVHCDFELRYPMWHVHDFTLSDSVMGTGARAALWYDRGGRITKCTMNGPKAFRECDDIVIEQCVIDSPELLWRCRGVKIKGGELTSEYLLLDSLDIQMEDVKFTGKYSFQYCENVNIANVEMDTKDAFWHVKNAVICDSYIKGEYIGWYSTNLTFINCTIVGTQPFCYCDGLRLINCKMDDADLAFEYADVDADLTGQVVSVKNPKSGRIVADSYGEIIRDNAVYPCDAEIITREK